MLKELIRALYKIRDAISGNSKDTVSNATLFDGIKMLFDKDVDESFMPVAMVNMDFMLGQTEESGFILLKETPIDTTLEKDAYVLLYDKGTELNASVTKSTNAVKAGPGGEPYQPPVVPEGSAQFLSYFVKDDPDSFFKVFIYAPYEHTIEINGTTYYYYNNAQ